nr:DUF1801 domain-containing protein [uncultured Carboxylicivirga sp.]
MRYQASTPEEYISQVPEHRKSVLQKLRAVIKENLSEGFEEGINYGMIGYYVPHRIYPNGYHCAPELPLPFLSIASQKNTINLYHSGIYADKELYEWFVAEYPKYTSRKLDMGKSCIRFKKMDEIPYELIGELCSKMSAKEWIDLYERSIKK